MRGYHIKGKSDNREDHYHVFILIVTLALQVRVDMRISLDTFGTGN